MPRGPQVSAYTPPSSVGSQSRFPVSSGVSSVSRPVFTTSPVASGVSRYPTSPVGGGRPVGTIIESTQEATDILRPDGTPVGGDGKPSGTTSSRFPSIGNFFTDLFSDRPTPSQGAVSSRPSGGGFFSTIQDLFFDNKPRPNQPAVSTRPPVIYRPPVSPRPPVTQKPPVSQRPPVSPKPPAVWTPPVYGQKPPIPELPSNTLLPRPIELPTQPPSYPAIPTLPPIQVPEAGNTEEMDAINERIDSLLELIENQQESLNESLASDLESSAEADALRNQIDDLTRQLADAQMAAQQAAYDAMMYAQQPVYQEPPLEPEQAGIGNMGMLAIGGGLALVAVVLLVTRKGGGPIQGKK